MDDVKWQIIVAECERLSEAAGVPLPAFPQPPSQGPVGQEWADPWLRESRRLDWLGGFLKRVGGALERQPDTEAPKKGGK